MKVCIKLDGLLKNEVALGGKHACLNVLTKQEPSPNAEKEEVKAEVERFIDLARQMEAFFLQKRFLLSAMKPELLVKEDNNELKCELQRKEELLRRHYDKIGQWQNLLADLQGHTVRLTLAIATLCTTSASSPQQQCMIQQQCVQQNLQVRLTLAIATLCTTSASSPQQQCMIQQQCVQQNLQMQSSLAQGMFLAGGRGYSAALQGPLAYLEKTATNIAAYKQQVQTQKPAMLRRCSKHLQTIYRRQGLRYKSSEVPRISTGALPQAASKLGARVISAAHNQVASIHFTSVLFEEQDVQTPAFPDSVSEGDVKLDKKVGDSVAQDEVVLEIETDKTALPVMAPGHGVIKELYVKDGDTVKAGQKLFRIDITAIRHAQAIETATVKVPPADYSKEIAGTRTEQRVKMNRMRQRIAQRLKDAQDTNAMLTTFNEIDMSAIMAFRKKNLDAFTKKHGVKLGLMSPFVKAAATALLDQPVVNAVIDGNDIVYRDYVDISVAVATPKGLVVPVIRNVQNMTYADIELTIAGLAEKARLGKLTIEEMDGGTFTISNGGVFGSLMGTPIINPPQSAILGMHGIFERPIALNGQVVIRPMMYIALTYDHRLIDGREAVMFLRKIKQGVEEPASIVAGL
ncbi:2-oxoacid dehydrogenases acyltransferase (catalytic domain) domain-containing protein [Phthorimaea operculella]|nr:2-oxoacid dehydrogenases acyltransferase (catalytic domain) domain-containing protein [Phthorimaea operculella]